MTITLNTDYDVTLNTALLGYVGETNARPVSVEGMEIDDADRYVLTIDYGDGTVYEVDITGGQWTPTADILRSAQTVSCQICAKKLSGDEYILVKKSRIFRLRIGAAIGDNAVPSPDVSMDALDRIDAIGRQVEADVTRAENAASTAMQAAETLVSKADSAEKSAQRAEQARDTAVSAEKTATQSADTAVKSADTAQKSADTAVKSADSAQTASKTAVTSAEQAHADMQTAVTAAETATTAANNATKSATAAEKSADTATQAASRAETAQASAETSATQAETAMQGAEAARTEAVKSQNAAKISAAQASASAQQTTADKNITAGYAKTAKTNADSTTADRQAVQEMAAQVTADKATVAENTAKVAEDRAAAETAAQTAQSIADSLPDDYVTAVGKIAENTAEISAVKLTDKELQRRVNALYDLGNGITHKFETDTDTAYTKTVPTGGKLMSVKNVGGRSIVFNQNFQPRKEINNGITATADSDGTITLNGTTTASYINFRDVTPEQNKVGKYAFKLLILNNPDSISMKFGFLNRSQSTPAITSGSSAVIYNQTQSEISLGKATGISGFAVGTVFNDVKIKIQIFDLTAMFGSGSEPSTVEEFEKMFPADYYPYNAGEIVSAGTEEIVEQGRNLINADDYYASCKQSDGSYVNGSLGFAYINIPIGNFIGKTLVATLKATVSAQPTSFFWLARIDGARVESSAAKGERVLANTTGIAKLTFTPKTKNDTLAMSYGQGRGDVIVRDIQVELGDTPTAYAPYHSNEYPIPEAIRNLPGYGWSAGTARNYVDYENKQYHQCVQSVDLGTLTWTAGGGSSKTVFIASSQKIYGQKLSYNSAIAANILCSKYLAKSQNEVWGDAAPAGIATNATIDGYVYVTDTAYTDAATFKQAMSGVILYYELEDPIVTDISSLIPDDFLRNIDVEPLGSITFKNSDENYCIPVPSEEEYVVKLSEVGGTT